MNVLKRCIWVLVIGSTLLFSSCKTDPVVPVGGVPIEGPTVQDPGEDNICENGVISFQHQVLPLMISGCAYSGCHDAVTVEDGVVLNNYENVMKEVSPGNPNDSELYEYIIETDPDDIMPPPPAAKFTTEQISIIRQWIEQGAENTDCGTPCDSTQTSFASDIFPLLQDYCIGCHNSTRSDGNVDIDNYNKIIPYVNNGALIATIVHDPLYPKMPPSGSKLSNCRISQIQKWINEGAQDN